MFMVMIIMMMMVIAMMHGPINIRFTCDVYTVLSLLMIKGKSVRNM